MKYLILPLAMTFVFFSCKKEVEEDSEYCTSCHNGDPKSFAIEGTVRDSLTGTPLSGVQVGHSFNYNSTFQDYSDSLGHFRVIVGWIEGGKWPVSKPSSVYLYPMPNNGLIGRTDDISTSSVSDGGILENIDLLVNPE